MSLVGPYFGLYFEGLDSPDRGVEPPAPPAELLSDAACLAWLRDRLVALGSFQLVVAGRLASPRALEDFPSAWVVPAGFKESDDVDPFDRVRIFKYDLVVTVRPDDVADGVASFAALDDLANLVSDNLTATGPVGCLPALSSIESGEYPPCDRADCLSARLKGEIGYTISTPNGRPVAYPD